MKEIEAVADVFEFFNVKVLFEYQCFLTQGIEISPVDKIHLSHGIVQSARLLKTQELLLILVQLDLTI